MRLRLAASIVAFAALVSGCTSIVGGLGHVAPSAGPGRPVTPPTDCPRVVYPAAKLSFDCVTTGLATSYRPNFPGQIWPLRYSRTVEATTNWVVEEGAGHWGSPEGSSLEDITRYIRQQMVDSGGYGEAPKVDTVASRPTTIAGAPAYLLQTTFTINPAWAREKKTAVKQEKLWILAIRVAPGDVSLWYTSVPDLTKSLWPEVPKVIASIRVG
jgi:hypothetical protein